ncbi:MAG: type II secretion system F family protein, partial [Candidatus Gracilibacteria bacterium]
MADFLILDDEKENGNDDNIQNSIKGEKSGSLMDKLNDIVVGFQSVKTKEKVIFYNLLSTMTNAGITLMKAMIVLEKQEKNPVFKKILGRFGEELKEGKNLSECMTLYPTSFGEAEIGIIKSGEKTGQLNNILSDLALQLEKVESLNGKIKGAMTYPMFILVVVIGVVSIMMTMIVPKLLEIFLDKEALPTSTKALIIVSNIFRDYWFVMIIVALLSYIGVSIWKRTPDGRYIFDNILL